MKETREGDCVGRVTLSTTDTLSTILADPVAANNTEAPIDPPLIHNGAEPGPHLVETIDPELTLKDIFHRVTATGHYNYQESRIRVPSGLSIAAWRRYLHDYPDQGLVDFLEFGWPINFDRRSPLQPNYNNHPSGVRYGADIDFYIDTEIGFEALAGPFEGPPVTYFHASPLMTRPKKDSIRRRVIMDLSWPNGFAVNDGIDPSVYIDGPAHITLPTAEYMVARLLELGPNAYMYKTDLARGYRQLRVDPWDWPLLGFHYNGKFYMDLCPPFGLKSSAMCMQRTSEAICFIHGKLGFYSRPYLDDFGGAEQSEEKAREALSTLQGVMHELGVNEAKHKVCQPATKMVWLGIEYDSQAMTMKIPDDKMEEVVTIVGQWADRQRATQREIQSLFGLLQFVASVSPPARIFTNRILADLREAPKRGSESLSLGFKKDLKFFSDLIPDYNGVRIIRKLPVQCQEQLELDSCLTGCGAYTGEQWYAEEYPQEVLQVDHCIAHLELLNVVVAIKVWGRQWSGTRVCVYCDNTNACIAIQTGRSRDPFMQRCARELFLLSARHDVEIWAFHRPGAQMQRADALSRAHLGDHYRQWIADDPQLQRARRVRVPRAHFTLTSEL